MPTPPSWPRNLDSPLEERIDNSRASIVRFGRWPPATSALRRLRNSLRFPWQRLAFLRRVIVRDAEGLQLLQCQIYLPVRVEYHRADAGELQPLPDSGLS
jgi:hypothetical protein